MRNPNPKKIYTDGLLERSGSNPCIERSEITNSNLIYLLRAIRSRKPLKKITFFSAFLEE